ncbi:Metallo-dependent phosphatase-like protein [Leucosporidium creatinivorum]|uniref:Metallo-dependent phosphatase-like protein n=1 Tax=Leucosporidium creatinivorum TaxID=106004 RepID=A0A1Y2F2D4_9BASI|nr:Metallo-dependent phosphatase-like protein [Leucosporidium creatinivorum]
MLLPLLLLPALAALSPALAAAVQLPFELGPLQQPDSSSPVANPYRQLPWGDVNIISTTDTHGWLMGHQRQEAGFSGDWGDVYSFVARMKDEARRRGVDLLLVDSGDRVDGNGLVDGEPAGHVKGWTAMSYFAEMPYDVITTGNHELYKYPVAVATYNKLAKHYGERYVTSNVNLTLNDQRGKQRTVSLGNKYRKFKTEQGRTVTAFGPLFDFKAHAAGIDVQAPHEMVKEPWFLDAIAEEPSFFLLVGHMSIRKEPDSEWSTIVKAIREVHPHTPITVFGGHHHIRDCVREDSNSMSLAAGRYMETVGWMSIKGIDSADRSNLEFHRRYLDQNRNTYKYHAGDDFDTKKGQSITKSLTQTAKDFNLTLQFGVAPQSYYLYRHPHTSDKSILKLLTDKVLPLLVTRPDRPYPSLTILNSGSIRFDIFKGPFTRNDQWIILPFTNSFEYIPSVPRSVAAKLLPYLNLVGEHHLASLTSTTTTTSSDDEPLPQLSIAHPHAQAASVELLYRRRLAEEYAASSSTSTGEEKLTPGYVTADKCSELGDDTLHRPIPAVWQPTFVSTAFPPPPPSTNASSSSSSSSEEEEDKIDIVFFDFIQPDILSALNALQKTKTFTEGDVSLFVGSLTANTLMQSYAEREWS